MYHAHQSISILSFPRAAIDPSSLPSLYTPSLSSIEPLARALKTASKDGTVVGPVMVSAYEALGDGPQEAGCADILLLPDNVQLRGVPLSDLTAVAMDSLSRPGAWEAGEETHGVAWVSATPLLGSPTCRPLHHVACCADVPLCATIQLCQSQKSGLCAGW